MFSRSSLAVLGLALCLTLSSCDTVVSQEEPPPPPTPRAELLTRGTWSLANAIFLEGGGTPPQVANRFTFGTDGVLQTRFFRPGQEDLVETSRWTLTSDQAAVILFQRRVDEPEAGRLDIVDLTGSLFVFDATIAQGRIRVTLER